MKRFIFTRRGGGRYPVWPTLLARLEIRRRWLLPLLVMFGVLLNPMAVWAAVVTTNVTAVTLSPSAPAQGNDITVTFTTGTTAAATDDTITYTVGGTAVAGTDYTDVGTGTCTFTAAVTTCTTTINVLPAATTSSTISVTSNSVPSADSIVRQSGAPVMQLTVPDNTTPTPNAVELFPLGTTYLNPADCVDFGYVTLGSTVLKTFTVGSANPTLDGSITPLAVTSVGFTPSPDTAFALTNPINLTTVTAPALPAVIPPTTPTPGVAYFDVTFNPTLLNPPASTSQATVISRQMQIFNNDTATIPTVNPLLVPIVATVVPTTLPKVQVTDSTTATPPLGTDIPSGTTTAVNFTPTPIGPGTAVNRTFSVRNGGFALLNLAPTPATFTPDTGTTAGTFTINAFADEGGAADPFNDTSAFSVSPPPPQGCGANNVVDYSSMVVTFTAPTVTTQTTFGGTVCFQSNDNLATPTATVDFCFPVTATVDPPPPTVAEIDIYNGDIHIPNLDNTGVDFGTTTVGSPVQRTVTVRNPSAVNLTVFDFSGNLPTGFSLLNANYASTIPAGGSTNLIFQLDATAVANFGAAKTECQGAPFGTGCALRIPNSDGDNPTWEFNGGGAENPYTIPFRGVVTADSTTNVALNFTQPIDGVVYSDTGGLNCGTGNTTCTVNYPPGTAVILTASPDDNASFTSWGGDCAGSANPLTVTMDTAKNCTATFTEAPITVDQFTLSLTAPSKGVVTSDTGGINCGTGGNTCSADYDASTVVTLTATPDDNANFSGWGGDCSGTTSPLEVTMNAAKNCTATFSSIVVPTDVTLTITPPSQGSIMNSTGSINCSSISNQCSATFSQDDTVQLIAVGTGVLLEAWGGDCAGNNNPLTVTMDTNKTCSATFSTGGTVTEATLTITEPTGGDITSGSGNINCGTNGNICTANYALNTSVQLTAIPDDGLSFQSWGGDCTGTAVTTTVTMNVAKNCTATFTETPTPDRASLNVTINGNGMVTPNPAGTSCGANCSAHDLGTTVTLTAIPSSGATFTGWSGDCTGTAASTSVTMEAAKNCTATFVTTTPPPSGTQTLNITLSGTGTVTSDVGGINCGTVCSASILSGSIVQLTASPADTFIGWSGACTGNNPTTIITMDSLRNCIAVFSEGGGSDPGSDPNVVDCFNQNGVFAGGQCLTGSSLHTSAVDAAGNPINITANVVGGISVNGGPYQKETTALTTDPVTIRATIKVDPADVGKPADILAAGLHYSETAYPPHGFRWYMTVGSPTDVRVWPSDDRGMGILSELTALTAINALPGHLVIDAYSGHLLPGPLDVYLGYRLRDSGKIVYAGPIRADVD